MTGCDFLIVGQGVAGSFLAFELMKQGKRVMVIDNDHHDSSSLVSAGIINPITGKRLILTPRYDLYYDCALRAYEELEQKLGKRYFEPKPIVRIFKNTFETEQWRKAGERGIDQRYFEKVFAPGTLGDDFEDSLGGVRINRCGFVRTRALLTDLRKYFIKKDSLENSSLSKDELKFSDEGVEYRGRVFERIIFCQGYQAQFNRWFDWLPFNSVKGEILSLRIEKCSDESQVFNKGKWCVPLGDKRWAAGSTYIWGDLNCKPSEEGKAEILEGLKYIRSDKQVVEHRAGVRPVLLDQKPVLGLHFENHCVAIFNGLGSKGFLMAPYYAKCLADFLIKNKPLPQDVSINRFKNLYQSCPGKFYLL